MGRLLETVKTPGERQKLLDEGWSQQAEVTRRRLPPEWVMVKDVPDPVPDEPAPAAKRKRTSQDQDPGEPEKDGR